MDDDYGENEAARKRAEEKRNEAEGWRVEADKQRASAETDRIRAELLRVANETDRRTGERLRVIAEDLRHQTEELRRSTLIAPAMRQTDQRDLQMKRVIGNRGATVSGPGLEAPPIFPRMVQTQT